MRSLLIIHESKTLRELLGRYILSELSDTYIYEAPTGDEAMKKLQEQKFNVVISGNKMSEMSGPEIFRKNRDFLPLNRKTPFIIMTSKAAGDDLEELARQGIQHFLTSPFTPEQFRKKIDAVCDPRNMRIYDRFSVPDTHAVIHLEQMNLKAKVVNISHDGVLCEVNYLKHPVDFLKSVNISVAFPPRYGNLQLRDLLCRVLRLNILGHDENNIPQKLRIVFQIAKINDQNKNILNQIFDIARKDFDALKRDPVRN